MTFWGGSGSFYFRHWPSRCQQITNFLTQFFSAYDFLKLHIHHFSKIKIQKESQNRRKQGFSYYFCMMIEGSGSIPLTSGSGSGSWRPKNTWIRWIRILEAQKHVDPVDPDSDPDSDPDPQHWFQQLLPYTSSTGSSHGACFLIVSLSGSNNRHTGSTGPPRDGHSLI